MKLGNIIPKYFAFSILPEWVKENLKTQLIIIEEISRIEKLLDKEKTEKILSKIKNEAYAQRGINSTYIINKLREIQKEILKNGKIKKH